MCLGTCVSTLTGIGQKRPVSYLEKLSLPPGSRKALDEKVNRRHLDVRLGIGHTRGRLLPGVPEADGAPLSQSAVGQLRWAAGGGAAAQATSSPVISSLGDSG